MLIRKARKVGSSIVISLPANILDAFGIQEGDRLDVLIIDNMTIGIQKHMDKSID